ncbi:hypothetical protein ACFXGA_37350 [Actinosynnema sp. NPDC059335]|uniref:hypothetical protein n=1 Tax=Actinosynnema sp. NPDC059335 TaxID=3346804 RepID=UPI00366B8616
MSRNPLQPFTAFIRLLWSVTTVGSAVALLLIAFASAGTSVCVTSQAGSELVRTVEHADGVMVGAGSLRLCLTAPGVGDRVLYLVDVVAPIASYAVLFFLLMRLLERGAVEGVHTGATADRLRRLGWFALVAVPAATLGEAAARIGLVAHVLPGVGASQLLFEWDVPWWAIGTGLGVLALSKIVRASAEMRADLEGTV